jgi:hypothetical protein
MLGMGWVIKVGCLARAHAPLSPRWGCDGFKLVAKKMFFAFLRLSTSFAIMAVALVRLCACAQSVPGTLTAPGGKMLSFLTAASAELVDAFTA